jgi:solute carrier family 25 (mitochondrial oxoglutarate transporter), member 11
LPLIQKAFIGLTAGAIGACVGSPADLALIRMQADSTLPAAQRRSYKNAFHALYRISADEGVLALWKGAGPTVVRAMSLNMGMLASYDQSVELFRDKFGAGEISTVIGKTLIQMHICFYWHLHLVEVLCSFALASTTEMCIARNGCFIP